MKVLKDIDIDLMMVDDELDILELSEMALNRLDNNFNILSTTDQQEVLDAVNSNDVDAIMSDYNMPGLNGVELLEEVRNVDNDLPFILYTGAGTEEIAEEAINAGVTDYFRKEAGLDHYNFISNSIESSVENYRDMERAEILSVLVGRSEQPIVVTDTDSTILYVNDALIDVSGYSEQDLLGANPNLLSSGEHSDEEFEEIYSMLNDGQNVEIDGMTNQTKAGALYVHDQELIPISVHGDSPDYFVGISNLKA